ncbi:MULTISPECIES: 4-carboxy-4-hydroxy-2-oxoadipate aldolase/oxaloacetate decarboxylase [Mesorhizobium]|uniref:4-carboxy-4-hydroxy-2-oxoadipate aldolase/oxaloacetate decarboxylase n=1 Tax=Mesorhizobium TaxID=68287 RepID=UPI0015F2E36F|nr:MULTISPECIES: 4-carboxy-4-hydroxy-2-oxoadipate aldolase/oxaloacetate decarboxylase [Mesorhizobium]
MTIAESAAAREILATLMELGSATIHEAQGQRGALCSAIKPADPASKLAGRAVTVDASPGDNLVIHYALSKARPGDVLVIDAKGFVEAGAWGDILTLAAQTVGIAGLVIDGAVRDAEAIIAMNFPTFSRGLSIKGTGKYLPGRVNIPIICGGVRVEPGDIVVGDRDGVVVVPANNLEAVLAASEKRAATEELYRGELKRGTSTIELLHLENVLSKLGMV